MGTALVVVSKEVDGETFVNTYAVGTGDYTAMLSEADLTAMVDIATLGADQVPAASPKVINAIVDFEMEFFPGFVNIQHVYVTDGRNLVEGADTPSLFLSKKLSIHGNSAVPATQEATQPGNVALLVSKVAGGFSTRPGGCQYRLVLPKSYVDPKGVSLVNWADEGSKTDMQDRLDAALASSGLVNHFLGGSASAGGLTGIAHYQPVSEPPTPQDGNIIGMTPIVAMSVLNPISRQVKRGRKEK